MLPKKLLRFRDLECVGITNWPTLKRRVEKEGFPPGHYVGKSRVWTKRSWRPTGHHGRAPRRGDDRHHRLSG